MMDQRCPGTFSDYSNGVLRGYDRASVVTRLCWRERVAEQMKIMDGLLTQIVSPVVRIRLGSYAAFEGDRVLTQHRLCR